MTTQVLSGFLQIKMSNLLWLKDNDISTRIVIYLVYQTLV